MKIRIEYKGLRYRASALAKAYLEWRYGSEEQLKVMGGA